MAVRVILLLIVVILISISSALYYSSELGVSPYDAQALTITEKTKFPFRAVRISVIRELILVKVRVSQANRQNVTSIAEIFRAKVVDVSVDSMVLELTGSKSKLEAFLQLLADGNEILELARTGVSGLSRGSDYVLVL